MTRLKNEYYDEKKKNKKQFINGGRGSLTQKQL